LDFRNFIRPREPRQPRLALTAEDKRLLLGASLRLLMLRYEAELPVFGTDLVRLARFADDAGLWEQMDQLASPPDSDGSETGSGLEST
jgi:hypothetical protein